MHGIDWLGVAIAISQTGMAAAALRLALKQDKRMTTIETRQDGHEKDNNRHVGKVPVAA